MAMEMDDDVFFEDLSKQIALLIMDDEEEEESPPQPTVSSFPVQRRFTYAPQAMVMPPPFAYEMSCRRESKGTGVFIPRSSCPRRKNNRSGKPSSISNTSQRQQERAAAAAPHSQTYHVNSSYKSGSGVPKRS